MSVTGLWDRYWEEIASGRVSLPVCSQCGRPNWYPTVRCRTCASDAFDWDVLGGCGEVFLAMWAHRDFSEQGRPVPYGVALVAPAEHPSVRMLAGVVGDELPIAGESVRLVVDSSPAGPIVTVRRQA